MRRPRSKLQVSMFPFLAVLLCVMGALLLLLFQMDRRGKIAAQHKVAAMKSERLARTKAEEDARKAEWERAKQALHQSLLTEQDQLQSQAKDLDANVNAANKKLDVVQTKHLDIKQKIEAESEKIALLQVELANQQDGVKASTTKESVSKAELVEAAKELADLELAFKKLRERKANEKATYSLVPYRGKHGDSRPPIYVECIGDGILFHPEKKLLAGLDFNAINVRSEVENRIGPLAIEKASKDKMRQPSETKSGPYVLFLVRPEGIANYYKAQSSLKGYQLDFGYELVDQHWALDFNSAPSAPPMHLAKSNVPPKVNPGLPLFPVNRSPNVGPGGVAGKVGNGPNASPFNSFAPPGTGQGNAGSPSLPNQPQTASNAQIGPPPLPGAGVNSTDTPFSSQPAGQGKGNGGPVIRPPTAVGNLSYNSVGMVKSPSFVPISKTGPPVPIATTGNNAVGGNSGNGTPQRPNGNSPSDVNPISAPIPGNSVGAAQRPGIPNDGAGSEAPSDPTSKPLPSFGAEPVKKPSAAPPVGRVLGNKDFVITIDCYADHVSVFPGGMTFRWTPATMKATDQALVQGIANLISKRQASVRPGEPPYRPVIRFQVSTEGLRSYYQAYPLLDSLGVPMRRENIDE